VRYVTHYNVSFVAPDDPVLGNVAHDLYLYPDADIASVAYHKDFLDRMQGVPYGAQVPAPGFEPRADAYWLRCLHPLDQPQPSNSLPTCPIRKSSNRPMRPTSHYAILPGYTNGINIYHPEE
jgi:hypothetical protein